jgi:hypothetical protein
MLLLVVQKRNPMYTLNRDYVSSPAGLDALGVGGELKIPIIGGNLTWSTSRAKFALVSREL